MNVGVVLACGKGERFGTSLPKQYNILNGKMVISYSIEALKKSKLIDEILVMTEESELEKIKSLFNVRAAKGGKERNNTIFNALKTIESNFDCDKVIILDSARPMITPEIIDEYINKLDEYDSVFTAQRITDSLGSKHAHVLDRSDYYLIQAPEAFRFDVINESFKADSSITATNQQLKEGVKEFAYFDFPNNMKITYKADLLYCEQLLKVQGTKE